MIYKPRCEYAHAERKTGALHCYKLNGYCAFQYRCEQTGQWENTPTAKGCKARKPKEETKILSAENPVAEMKEISKGAELAVEQKFHGSETTVEKIADTPNDETQTAEQTDALETVNTPSTPHTATVSERRKATDEVERSENQTARRASGTKRGRRKKRDDVPSDAAQTGTGGTADERLHPESRTVPE